MLHKRYGLRAGVLIVGVLVVACLINVFNSSGNAAADCESNMAKRKADNVGCQPAENTKKSAQALAIAMCTQTTGKNKDKNDKPSVGYGAYADPPANISYFSPDGTTNLTIHLYIIRCQNRYETRDFAITGYQSGNFLTCPISGSYAGGYQGDPKTHDCVKYVGDYKQAGETLRCQKNSTSPLIYNDPCFSSIARGDPYDGITKVKNGGSTLSPSQPPTSMTSITATISQALTVPGWTTTAIKDNQDSYKFTSNDQPGERSAFCEFYKTDSFSDNDQHFIQWCQQLIVTVHWTHPVLTPYIKVTPQGGITSGQPATVTGNVINSGNVKINADWRIDVKKYSPGVAHANGGATTNSTASACSGADCSLYAGIYTDTFDKGGSSNATKTAGPGNGYTHQIAPSKDPHDTTNDPIGTSYCYWTSVQSGGQWKHSAPACFTVGVYPSVQFLGYDVKIGGRAVTHPFTIGNGTFGSWGEFGGFSQGTNTGFASGAGLAGVTGSTSSSQSDWSNLTFANDFPPALGQPACPGGFGCYGMVNYPGSTIVAGLANMCGSLIANPIIAANPNANGVICSDSPVTITGNQTYNEGGMTTSSTSLPQQVIIAPSISIAGNVQEVDSWLVATGTVTDQAKRGNAHGGVINTCAEATITTKLTTNTCNKQLTVVGPVITKELDVLRTYYGKKGDGSYDPTVPAEIFNLRADAFLWAYQGKGSGTPVAQTTSVTDLPPRF